MASYLPRAPMCDMRYIHGNSPSALVVPRLSTNYYAEGISVYIEACCHE